MKTESSKVMAVSSGLKNMWRILDICCGYAGMNWKKGDKRATRQRLQAYLLVQKNVFIPYFFPSCRMNFHKRLSGLFKILLV